VKANGFDVIEIRPLFAADRQVAVAGVAMADQSLSSLTNQAVGTADADPGQGPACRPPDRARVNMSTLPARLSASTLGHFDWRSAALAWSFLARTE
jgi:hypothetical protein